MGVPVLTPPLVHDTDALAEDVMALLQKIVDEMDSNIDRDNLKDLEVITSKLAAGAVTTPKLADKAVTPPKIGLKGASVFHTAAQSFGGANTVIFNSEYWDTDGCHTISGSNNLLTCKTAGLYYIWGDVKVTGVDVAGTILWIRVKPGAADERRLAASKCEVSAVESTLSVAGVWPLAVNDPVDLLISSPAVDVPGQDGSVPYFNNFGMVALGAIA